MAKREVKLGNVKGLPGTPAKFVDVSIEVTPGHLDEPTVDVNLTDAEGGQNLNLTFNGIQGPKGDMGPIGDVDSNKATVDSLGTVKPDGKTIKITEDGTIYLDLDSLKFEVKEDGHLWVSYDDGNEG